MVYNLAIVGAMWSRTQGHRVLLAGSAGLLVLGALSAGEFSGVIGLVVPGRRPPITRRIGRSSPQVRRTATITGTKPQHQEHIGSAK